MARTEKQNSKEQSTKGAGKAALSSGSSVRDTPDSSYISKASEPVSTRAKGPDQAASASGDGSSGRLRRAASKVRSAISRARNLVSRRGRNSETSASAAPGANATPPRGRTDRPTPVRVQRESDIPMEQLEQSYTPRQTSLKSGFRFDGSERQRDQEFANGAGEERWSDEDRFTNKSNDPRIGTHGRTYEPGEHRASSDDTE
jgi:hypothetical protein